MTQDPLKACPAPKLVKSEGKIEWDLPAGVLFNLVRAFVPFPGSYTFLNRERLVIEQAALLDTDDIGEEPATVLAVTDEGFDVQCGRGTLRVLRVRPEGKKSMSGRDFANGRNLQKGMKFA
jgi:methionyl-tRNA formyltransferase